jgi:ribosomal protein S18 acetylase RimI-like enzyme
MSSCLGLRVVSVELQPFEDEAMANWMAKLRVSYVADRISTGESEEEANRVADAQLGALFPEGRLAAGNEVWNVCADGQPVGTIWIGPRNPEYPLSYWVWDVVIDEDCRGKGYGRAAMVLAEERARELGATDLGLNVFGYNTVARHLYESLGYETMAVQMRKTFREA